MRTLIVVALLCSTSCSWIRGHGQKVLDCAAADVQAHMSKILPIVFDLLANGSDWQVELETLAEKYGADLIACVVQQVMQNRVASGHVSERGHLYLKSHR